MHRVTTRRLATIAVAGATTPAVLAPTASAADAGKASPQVRAVGKPVLKDQSATGHLDTWSTAILHG